jgi:hypothetical protein
MATSEELRLFLQERLRAFDSTITLDAGSPANVQVVEPTVRRYLPDPLETDLELFIRTRLAQEFPNLHTGEGSALVDSLVKPMRVLLEPFVREIRAVKRNQSLIDPDVLNKDEADALVSNVFVRRSTGGYARGQVRAYFENATSVNIGGSNFAFTSSGKRFHPVSAQSITSESMLANQDGELFYYDVDYIAEGQGKSYNVSASEITGITNLPAATRVTNLRKFEDGDNEETTVEVVSRSESSIGERSLTTVPGIVGTLFDQFSTLRILQAIGYNDAEMLRDVLTGGNLGEPIIWGTTGSTSDDGDGDGYTSYFRALGAGFSSNLGPNGTDLSTSYVLTLWLDLTGTLAPYDFNLKEVVSSILVSISDEYTGADRLPDSLSAVYWTVRKKTLTLSGVPGGIMFPDINGTTVDIKDNEVHVGGCTDIYVAGPVPEDEVTQISLFGTHEAALSGITAETILYNNIYLNDTTLDEFLRIIPGVSSIRLLSGSDVGTYKVCAVTWNGADTIRIEVQETLTTADSDLRYDIIDSIDIKLTDPQEIVYSGADLRTYAGSDMVDTAAGVTWADYGVTSDHVLKITTGDDIGEYDIDTVSGSALFVSTGMDQTAGSLQFEILRKQTAGIDLPLVRVTSVELLDANLEPTGDYVPYRHPIEVQSRSFQNPGRGMKAGTADVTTDDKLTVDPGTDPNKLISDNTSIDYYDLGVRPGDIVNILTGDNLGYYTVAEDGVGGSPSGPSNGYELVVVEELGWSDSDMSYEVGGPSYGSFRVYFLEPATFEATYRDTLISVELSDGSTRRFRPDPTIWDEYFPTDVTIPTARVTAASPVISLYSAGGASSYRTQEYGVDRGDRVEITYAPIVGSLDITSAIDLDGQTLLFDLGLGSERVNFTGTIDIDEIVSQVNAQLSRSIAVKWENGPNTYFAVRSDQEITLMDNSADSDDATAAVFGTTPTTNNPWLTTYATFANETIPNDSPYKGYWFIVGAADESVTLEDASGSSFNPTYSVDSELGHYLVFGRLGRQRISSTDLDAQRDSLGLYYFDVECISEGHGDTWNIEQDQAATITGYSSEGWELSTEDSNMSYSMAEVPWMHVTPRVLIAGSQNDPSNYIELVGNSFGINYERSSLAESVHSYVRDQQSRVVCQNPLVRHLTPIFVRTDVTYTSGPTVSDARTDLVSQIEDVVPEQQLEVSDLTGALTKSGATYIHMPVTVIGIKHDTDRTLSVERSQDVISAERLSSLIPDDDGTTTEGASWIQLTRT